MSDSPGVTTKKPVASNYWTVDHSGGEHDKEDVDRAIEDAKKANTELHIKNNNGKVFQNNFEIPERGEEDEEIRKLDKNSELELLSNVAMLAQAPE